MPPEQSSLSSRLATDLPKALKENSQELDGVTRNIIPLENGRELFLAVSEERGLARVQLSTKVSIEVQEEGDKKSTTFEESVIVFEVADFTGTGQKGQYHWLEFHSIGVDHLLKKVRYPPDGRRQILPEMQPLNSRLMKTIINEGILPKIEDSVNEIIPEEIDFQLTESAFIDILKTPNGLELLTEVYAVDLLRNLQ